MNTLKAALLGAFFMGTAFSASAVAAPTYPSVPTEAQARISSQIIHKELRSTTADAMVQACTTDRVTSVACRGALNVVLLQFATTYRFAGQGTAGNIALCEADGLPTGMCRDGMTLSTTALFTDNEHGNAAARAILNTAVTHPNNEVLGAACQTYGSDASSCAINVERLFLQASAAHIYGAMEASVADARCMGEGFPEKLCKSTRVLWAAKVHSELAGLEQEEQKAINICIKNGYDIMACREIWIQMRQAKMTAWERASSNVAPLQGRFLVWSALLLAGVIGYTYLRRRKKRDQREAVFGVHTPQNEVPAQKTSPVATSYGAHNGYGSVTVTAHMDFGYPDAEETTDDVAPVETPEQTEPVETPAPSETPEQPK